MENVSLADFELAIGRLSIRWAIAEHALDRTISILHHAYGGDGKNLKLPLNAKAKIKYFKRAGIHHFPNARSFTEDIAGNALRVLEERNWCIHGTAVRFEAEAVTLPIELRRLARPEMLEEERRTVSIEHINDIADDAAYLAVLFALWQCRPLGAIPEDHIYDVFRRFGVQIPF